LARNSRTRGKRPIFTYIVYATATNKIKAASLTLNWNKKKEKKMSEELRRIGTSHCPAVLTRRDRSSSTGPNRSRCHQLGVTRFQICSPRVLSPAFRHRSAVAETGKRTVKWPAFINDICHDMSNAASFYFLSINSYVDSKFVRGADFSGNDSLMYWNNDNSRLARYS
jgi:hypothetical protein